MYSNIVSCGENIRTPHEITVCGPQPGKEPLQDVDGTVVVAIHGEFTFRATVGPFLERHGLEMPTATTLFGRVAFIYSVEIFPREHTFVAEHLHEGVEAPLIIHRSIELFVALFVFLHDHLPLGQISDHHGSLNQSVGDEMRCFMQRVLPLVALTLRDALVDLGEVDVAPRLLLTFISLRANFVKLFVVPLRAFEAADVVEAPLLVDPSC